MGICYLFYHLAQHSFNNQSNKLLANLPSNDAISGFKMDAFAPMPLQVQSMPIQVQSMPLQSPQVQVGEGTQDFKGIKLLGFEKSADQRNLGQCCFDFLNERFFWFTLII